MHGPPSGPPKCASRRIVPGPTQSARAHAKCGAALWVRGTRSARKRAKCVGRGSIARAALSARAAIAWRGEWAALPAHLPRTCHAMPTQCNRGSTRVGRNEPQSPGTLRASMKILWKKMIAIISECQKYILKGDRVTIWISEKQCKIVIRAEEQQ